MMENSTNSVGWWRTEEILLDVEGQKKVFWMVQDRCGGKKKLCWMVEDRRNCGIVEDIRSCGVAEDRRDYGWCRTGVEDRRNYVRWWRTVAYMRQKCVKG